MSNKEIAILGRSMLWVVTDLASYIGVPETHVLDKRVAPTFRDETTPETPIAPPIRVHSTG
jgi:hypothetical protein